MLQAELEARARQRAKDRRIHVMAVPGRPGVYTVSSASEPGTKRTLVNIDGVLACSCPGYFYRKSCVHAEALKDRLAREAVIAERRQRRLKVVARAEDLYGPAA